MPAAARVDPRDFFTPEEWAPLTARSSWKGLALVAHAWGVIALAAAAATVWPVLIPLAVMIIGPRQLGLAILMHEAAHGGLHPNGKLNDVLGHWFCAVPIGASLDAYRPYHLRTTASPSSRRTPTSSSRRRSRSPAPRCGARSCAT